MDLGLRSHWRQRRRETSQEVLSGETRPGPATGRAEGERTHREGEVEKGARGELREGGAFGEGSLGACAQMPVGVAPALLVGSAGLT